jgi:hypothetical protein
MTFEILKPENLKNPQNNSKTLKTSILKKCVFFPPQLVTQTAQIPY